MIVAWATRLSKCEFSLCNIQRPRCIVVDDFELISKSISSKMPQTICDVILDGNPLKVIYSGQAISGRVVLKLFKEKSVRGNFQEIR